jgi:uncharacterized membrane protein YoaK (UPF0700 family)
MKPEEALPPTEMLNPRLNRFSLLHGALLAIVGGFLDAFTFVEKGHVFANAMTGNVVLLGVSTAAGNWVQAGGNLLPILAFLMGIVVAEILKNPRVQRAVHWSATICLVTETVLLLMIGALPSWVPDYGFTLSISFIATLQNSMFPKIEKHTIATVMTTANLRSLFQTLTALAFSHPHHDAASKVRIFGTVCASFLFGAVLGGLVSPLAHNRALWVPSALLLLICATLLWTVSAPRRLPSESIPNLTQLTGVTGTLRSDATASPHRTENDLGEPAPSVGDHRAIPLDRATPRTPTLGG